MYLFDHCNVSPSSRSTGSSPQPSTSQSALNHSSPTRPNLLSLFTHPLRLTLAIHTAHQTPNPTKPLSALAPNKLPRAFIAQIALVMMYISVDAYGEDRFDLIFNPCNANIKSLCPMNVSSPIKAEAIIPVGSIDVQGIPPIALPRHLRPAPAIVIGRT